ncbi:MAG TPA: hypothetical protein VI957_03855, partial [Candidatus Paceibacterota bacterium]
LQSLCSQFRFAASDILLLGCRKHDLWTYDVHRSGIGGFCLYGIGKNSKQFGLCPPTACFTSFSIGGCRSGIGKSPKQFGLPSFGLPAATANSALRNRKKLKAV